MAQNPNSTNKMRQSVVNTITRASVKFEMKDGSDAGNLMIENERLKTSVAVLQDKLKVQDMNQDENNLHQKRNREKNAEIEELKTKVSSLET